MTSYYADDRLTVYHADAREVLAQLGAFDLILTDPPYAPSGAKKEWQLTASVAIVLNQTGRMVRKGGMLAVFSAASGRGIQYVLSAVDEPPLNRVLVWHKTFVRSRVAGPWRWDIVPILCFGRASFGRPQWSSLQQTIGPASNNHLGSKRHPAEIPSTVSEWLFAPWAGQHHLRVLDPFAGTGSLLRPAYRAGCSVVAIEKDEAHCETLVEYVTEPIAEGQVAAPDAAEISGTVGELDRSGEGA